MMKSTFTSLLAFSLLGMSTGCATKMPMSAAEFRQGAGDSMWAKTESFEVDRSYRDIGKTFKEQADKCLNVTVVTTTTGPGNNTRSEVTYRPTVVLGKQRAELHLQQHFDKALKVYDEPPGGYYAIVADATPISSRKSRVDIYAPKFGQSVTIAGIKNWARGTTGCPDLTKN